MSTKKRGPYKKIFHKPLFGEGLKTTTPDGYRLYQKQYQKALTALKVAIKKENQK